MILIQSLSADQTTTNVVKWLNKFQCSWKRLNDLTKTKSINYVDENFVIETEKDTINFKNVKGYWFRRGKIIPFIKILKFSNIKFRKKLEHYLFEEMDSVVEFFKERLSQIPHIGSYETCVNVNKHLILLKAQKLGLNIPPFIITNNKTDVVNFLRSYKKIITKPLHLPFDYSTSNYWYPTYTVSVNEMSINNFPQHFQSTIFQKEIEKKFELRIFFLMGEFYSMAIFSQNNQKTRTDFRMYDYRKPNRKVPYKIPSDLMEKLSLLMKDLNLQSASIDVLYSIDGKYYFLEVNPIGQFGMVSYPCNYFLEKRIAQELNKFECA